MYVGTKKQVGDGTSSPIGSERVVCFRYYKDCRLTACFRNRDLYLNYIWNIRSQIIFKLNMLVFHSVNNISLCMRMSQWKYF